MIKQSRKIRLPADLYSRNTFFELLTQYILDQRTPEEHQRSLEILDIGGYEGKLAWFMPQHTKVTVLDQKPAPEEGKTNYVQGDARRLPFPDNSFDLVLSSDMIEHIAPEDRLTVLREMQRVSRRHIILAAPFQSIYNQKAEELINSQFREYTGQDHPFLSEHLQNGLPELEQFEQYLSTQPLSYIKIGEGNIYNWYLHQLATAAGHPLSNRPNPAEVEGEKIQTFNEFFNDNLSKLGNFRAPTYRTVLFCDKSAILNRQAILEKIEEQNNFHTTTYFEAYKKAFNEIRLRATTEREGQSKILHSQIHEVQVIINEKRGENHQLQQQISSLENQLRQVSQQFISNTQKFQLMETQISSQDLLLGRLKVELEQSQKSEQELTNLIVLKEHNLHEKNQDLAQKNKQITGLQASLSEYKHELETVLNSRSWKLVRLYGHLKNTLYLRPKYLISIAWNVLHKMGFKEFLRRVKRKLFKTRQIAEQSSSDYQKYLEEIQLTAKDIRQIKENIQNFEYKPLISIVVPVYNVPEVWLRKAINSILNQYYEKWELCLADDASTEPHIKSVLKEYAALDPRIKVQYRPQNGGIVKASNTAFKMAQGAYIGLLDNDDELTPNALYEVVKALQETRYDLIYSDEDKLEMDGTPVEPYYKSDFDQDLLFSNNYICHFSVFRRKIMEEVGAFREGTDGSQDYDLVLRFTDKKRSIRHIPKVLYHWRKIPGSTAATVEAKPYVFEAAKKALRDTLKRRGIKGEVLDGIWKGSYRVKREILGEPLVSIIIPFRDKVDILRICLDSIFAKTTYENYEILLVNNSSELLETREYMREIENCPRVRLLHYNAPFNFSAINNFASLRAEGEYLLLLNNDTEVIDPDWIQSMLEHAQRPEVGCVGAKLLYPNNLIQHAGVIIGVGGAANHCYAKFPSNQNGYFGQLNIVRQYSAVTAACIMIRKTIYEEMDGLDEENLAVSFNDVDFCLRLREKGYLNIYTPYALLYHHESLSRGYNVSFNEEYYLRRRHQGIFQKGDPYYNPNLSSERLDFTLKVLDKVSNE
jgi:GT2 family glycosyltransferase